MVAIISEGRFDWTLFGPEDTRFEEIVRTSLVTDFQPPRVSTRERWTKRESERGDDCFPSALKAISTIN
jgi:hypothetical protein